MNLRPDGTGPYKIVESELPRKLVLAKNSSYYPESPKGRPSIGKIGLRVIPDMNTQVAELLSGRLDLLLNVPADMAEDLGKNPIFKLDKAGTMRCWYLIMEAAGRGGDTPFKNLKVRQAVSHAVDREGIVKNLVRGPSQVLHSPCYPDQFGCASDVTKYDYNPEKARRLLAEAGYPSGFKTKLYSDQERAICEAIINNLKAVGITAEFQYVEFAAMRSGWRKGETPIALTTWGSSSIADVSAFTPVFFKMNHDDVSHDPEITNWFTMGDTAMDPQVRLANYAKAYRRIAEQAYWLPMFTGVMNYVYVKDLDFKPTTDELPQFYNTRWK